MNRLWYIGFRKSEIVYADNLLPDMGGTDQSTMERKREQAVHL